MTEAFILVGVGFVLGVILGVAIEGQARRSFRQVEEKTGDLRQVIAGGDDEEKT